MSKRPEKAPDWKRVKVVEQEGLTSILQKANERYYYWDKFRVQRFPKGADREAAWAYLKLQREGQLKELPLKDVEGRPFRFWLPEHLQAALHQIDRWASPTPLQPQHLIHSLIEEASTSSQVEGAATTLRVAKKMLLSGRKPRDRSERMIYNNFQAMQAIKEYAEEPLSHELLMELHDRITEGTLRTEDRGRYRETSEDVRVEDMQGEVVFEPPPAERIGADLDALIAFANDGKLVPHPESSDKLSAADLPDASLRCFGDEHIASIARLASGGRAFSTSQNFLDGVLDTFVHPVVRAIFLHFALAYIHPFVDGNGRTARALFYWYMIKSGYWHFEYLSISKVILQKLGQYGRAYLYTEVDEADLTYFLHFNLGVITDAVNSLHEYLLSEHDQLADVMAIPGLNLRQSRVVLHALKNPREVFTIKEHQTESGVAYQTARTDLLGLEREGLLTRVEKGNSFYFIVPSDLQTRLAI